MAMRLFTLLLTLCTLGAYAQDATINRFVFERSASINFKAEIEDWNVNVQHLEAPAPGISGLRADLHQKKLEIMQRYPANLGAVPRAAAGPAPTLGNNFEGNNFQGVPNDNDMATSNDSMIMSVTNSRIHFYNAATEEQLLTRSLATFSNQLGISGSKFDPKVIYDPGSDRFILIFLKNS